MEWEVYRAYLVEGPFIEAFPERGLWRTYDPLEDPNCLVEFASVREGDLEGLEDFVAKWGMLEADQERLEWLWGHVRNIRLVLRLFDRVGRHTAESLAAALPPSSRPGRVGLTFAARLDYALLGFKGWHRIGIDLAPANDAAKRIIAEVISINLDDLSFALDPDTLQWRPSPEFKSLRQAIYWHLAQFVTGAAEYGVCQECGNLFPRTHGRQKFCPPPAGYPPGGSLCGDRHRKRLRSRQKRARNKGGEDDGRTDH